jgi:hypothetical protein
MKTITNTSQAPITLTYSPVEEVAPSVKTLVMVDGAYVQVDQPRKITRVMNTLTIPPSIRGDHGVVSNISEAVFKQLDPLVLETFKKVLHVS